MGGAPRESEIPPQDHPTACVQGFSAKAIFRYIETGHRGGQRGRDAETEERVAGTKCARCQSETKRSADRKADNGQGQDHPCVSRCFCLRPRQAESKIRAGVRTQALLKESRARTRTQSEIIARRGTRRRRRG